VSVAEASATDQQLVEKLTDELLAEFPPATTDPVTFLGAQYDKGLGWVHFPVGNGGLGLPPKLQGTVDTKLRAAGAPDCRARNPIGHGMSAPTIVVWGSDAQKARLRSLFTGEEIWCQLFSEPGAGSDVAGLSSRAVKDGDEWIVNGQKVWTTLGHVSRYGTLVVRTDPNQAKHAGLTHFVVDMHAPGVEVRPLRQMTGDAEFNEVYFTDVRIPDSERLGNVGDGWRVALTTLMNERVSIGGAAAARGSGPISMAVKLFKEYEPRMEPAERVALRDQLMELWCGAETNRLTNIRAAANRKVGTPGPEGSTGKLAFAELNKAVYEFCMNIMGPDALLYNEYNMTRGGTMSGSNPVYQFLRSRANSIEGGTSEVMRNILGERVLGLPGDVRTDKDKPWVDVPRN
jgi:alkylation response protein AidB-like acyl-CoA dehydrogenase